MDLEHTTTILGGFVRRMSAPLRCWTAAPYALGLGGLALALALTLPYLRPTVTISDSTGAIWHVRSAGTVAATLADAGVTLGPGDEVSSPLEGTLPEEARLHVLRGVPVTITGKEGTFEIWTTASDIAGLKDHPVLKLGPNDRLWPRSGTPITPGMTIKLARVVFEDSTAREPVPPPIEFVQDATLPRGASALVSAGTAGEREVTVRRYYKDGAFMSEAHLPGVTLKLPVPEVRKVGIRTLTLNREMRGNRVMYMEATAYEPGPRSCGIYADGRTATGRIATYGVCAVDPRVIPLGTRLFIEGYGVALACDTGGAIKGMKVDVCFDTVAEALRWGRRRVKVYILDQFSGTIPIPDRAGQLQRIVAVSKPSASPASNVIEEEPKEAPAPAPAPIEPVAASPSGPINLLDPSTWPQKDGE